MALTGGTVKLCLAVANKQMLAVFSGI